MARGTFELFERARAADYSSCHDYAESVEVEAAIRERTYTFRYDISPSLSPG